MTRMPWRQIDGKNRSGWQPWLKTAVAPSGQYEARKVSGRSLERPRGSGGGVGIEPTSRGFSERYGDNPVKPTDTESDI
ncbi:MAG TPA: hypothetical protein VI543_09055 [Sulfuricaulis sp.]|nr:hypothetical protein [Sulfuricaulis sp.]